MKFQLLIFIIGLYYTIPTDGRLILKNKTRNVEEVQTDKPNPSIRLTRDIENDPLTGFSKEALVQSEEFIKAYNKKAIFFFKSKPKASKIQALRKTRIVRDSIENIKPDPKSKKVKELKKPANAKAVLVKKPIPKFDDKDYDDFQSKISKSHNNIISDSGEHEDEDFNLEDYEFDINHDEFTSGRKPLEPRITRVKNAEPNNKKPNMKIISKVVVPDNIKTVSNKKERAAELNTKKTTNKMKEVDYYDDMTTTKSPERSSKAQDDEYSEENDDSKEIDRNNSSIRTARSWNINLFGHKFNDQVSRIANKFLGILPLFPEVPDSYQIEAENPNTSDESIEHPTGRQWISYF